MRIIFFTEPSRDKWRTHLNMGNLYMNRFAIDEDAAFEVLKMFELKDRVHQTDHWSRLNRSLDATWSVCSSHLFCSIFTLFVNFWSSLFGLFGEDRLRFRWPLLKELSHKNKGNERKEIGNRSNKKCNSPLCIDNQLVMTLTCFSNYKISVWGRYFWFKKEKFDNDIFDSGLKFISDIVRDDLKLLMIYVGEYYMYYGYRFEATLTLMLLQKMKKYKIPEAILCKILGYRWW